jgi:hypothetical protein
MTTTEPAWTEQDSRDLDAWAQRSYRNPLRRNQTLWEQLTPDRIEAPRRMHQRATIRDTVCIDCRRALRHSGDDYVEGTTVHWARGICCACRNLRQQWGIPMPPPQKNRAPEYCVTCNQPMTTAREKVKGKVRHAAHGMCQTCHQRHRRAGRPRILQKRPDNCTNCGHALRGSNIRAADAPGTRRYAGRGLCNTCHEKKERNNGLRSATT